MKTFFSILTVLILSLGLMTPSFAGSPTPATPPWPEPPYTPSNVSFSTSGNQTLVAAPSSFATCVYGLLFVNSGTSATTINIYQDGGTTSVSSVYLTASGGSASWVLSNNPKNPYFITNTTTAFVINSSAATQINGTVYSAQCP